MVGRAALSWLDGASCGLPTAAAAMLAYDAGMMLICLDWAVAASLAAGLPGLRLDLPLLLLVMRVNSWSPNLAAVAVARVGVGLLFCPSAGVATSPSSQLLGMLVPEAGGGLPRVLGRGCGGRGGGGIAMRSNASSRVRRGAMACCMTLVSISVLGAPLAMPPMSAGG